MRKALKKLIERVKRTNAAFEKMSLAEKRVRIAKDVLAQMEAKKLIPESGIWLRESDNEGGNSWSGPRFRAGQTFRGEELSADTQVSDMLRKVPSCNACAIGALFLAAIDRADKLNVEDVETDNFGYVADGEFLSAYLKRFFSESQLNLIEDAFEQGIGGLDGGTYSSAHFASEAETSEERMVAVMENIIENDGKFVPPHVKEPKEELFTLG